MIRVFRIPAAQIAYLSSLMETYEGIGLVRTLDEAKGIIECWLMPYAVESFERMLAQLRSEFPLQSVQSEFD